MGEDGADSAASGGTVRGMLAFRQDFFFGFAE